MVSGLVTSPWDQDRIFSGLARLMRMESKSAIKLARSYGLLRYKVVSSLPGFHRGRDPVFSTGPAENPKNQTYKTRKCCIPGGAACCAARNSSAWLIRGLFRRRLLPLHQFDVQAEGLQLTDQDVERLGHAGFDTRFAFDDGLVDFCAAINVVGLRREQLLQDVRGAVGLERPDFHFAEALAAELRFATERLLGDERVRTDGPCVNLVVDEVRKFEHVDVADRDRLIELLAGHTVEEIDLSGVRQASNFEQVADFRFPSTVEDRRGKRNAFLEAFGVIEQLIVAQF